MNSLGRQSGYFLKCNHWGKLQRERKRWTSLVFPDYHSQVASLIKDKACTPAASAFDELQHMGCLSFSVQKRETAQDALNHGVNDAAASLSRMTCEPHQRVKEHHVPPPPWSSKSQPRKQFKCFTIRSFGFQNLKKIRWKTYRELVWSEKNKKTKSHKHELKSTRGLNFRQFQRNYSIPFGFNCALLLIKKK